MRHSLKTGFSFGLTSAIITTLGLIMGLHSGTHSRHIVIGGILTIAIADAFSDALGIHISEEAENVHTLKEIWESTISTFLTKFVFAIIFALFFLFLPIDTAIVISIIWGFLLLGIFSFFIAKDQGVKPWKVIAEHIFIASVVIVITHLTGEWIGKVFE